LVSCPICKKRKPERFCPAKGEKICAVCCGTEREVTIDCPADCAYLLAAHRYEARTPKTFLPEEVPFSDVEFSQDLAYERRPVVSGLAFTILKFAAENPTLTDGDAIAALRALAETYRTLGSGILYEKPPDAPLPHGLYAALAKFIAEAKQQDTQQAGFTTLKDSEIFFLLVFLFRVGLSRTNGRPRSRIYLEFLRLQFPQTVAAPETSRIIVP
jgi:hypothetical protein